MSNSVLMIGVLIDELIKEAAVLYDILERDTHKSTYTLLGKHIDVTIKRKVYVEAAGNILEKGKVKVEQVQSDESDVEDVKVGKEKQEQGEGESEEKPSKEKTYTYQEEVVTALEEEEQIEKWWNSVRNFWGWSGCVVGDKWRDLLPDGRDEIRKVYFSLVHRNTVTLHDISGMSELNHTEHLILETPEGRTSHDE